MSTRARAGAPPVTPAAQPATEAKASLFDIGALIATPNALFAIDDAWDHGYSFLRRDVTGDWGDLCPEDRQANEQGLKEGGRLLLAYTLSSGEKLWIVTEWYRSVTTLLLPDEC